LLGIILLSVWVPVGVMADAGGEEYPRVPVDSIGTRYVGEQFTLYGTTNLAAGTILLVEIRSSSFKPTTKNESGEFSGISETVVVIAGDPYNYWECSVDTSSFRPDEYTVTVEAVETGVSTSGVFRVLQAPPMTTPAPTPTTEPATTLSETPPQTEAAASGVVLVSLLMVALLSSALGRSRGP
jgi:hypothetical protein